MKDEVELIHVMSLTEFHRRLSEKKCNPLMHLDVLRSLKEGLDQHPSISQEDREKYLNYISIARKEYDEIAKQEVQKAFVYSYEESAKTLMDNYLDNVEAYCNKNKLTRSFNR